MKNVVPPALGPLSVLVTIILASGCSSTRHDEPVGIVEAENPYLGESPPGGVPVMFAPGIVSTPDHIELGITFSSDGTEIYFARSAGIEIDGDFSIWVMREGENGWEPPRVATFSTHRDFAPFMMPDGERFLFYSQDHSNAEYRSGTYMTVRTGNTWSLPVFYNDAYCITSTLEGDLFSSAGGADDRNIMMFRETDVGFTEPREAGAGVNSTHHDAHSYVAPDGSVILFDSSRPGEFDHSEIHVSFRDTDGTWTDALSLGPQINGTPNLIPSLSPDGRYIFFSRDNDIWWVSSQIIHELAEEHFGHQVWRR